MAHLLDVTSMSPHIALSKVNLVKGLFLLFGIVSCSSLPPGERHAASSSFVSSLQNPRFSWPAAEKIPEGEDSALLHELRSAAMGSLGTEARQALLKKCATSQWFCPLIREAPSLGNYFRKKVTQPSSRVPMKKIAPSFSGKAITNWDLLRKTDVENLLLAIAELPPESLALLHQRVQTERRCPNSVAIAVAATLEDKMPNQANPKEIAELYQKGSRCFPLGSSDRENYATRAGLLFYFTGLFSEAGKALSGVRPSDALSGRAPYWLYRAQKALGDIASADKTYKRLLTYHPLSFHTLVLILQRGEDPEKVLFRPVRPAVHRSRHSEEFNRWIPVVEKLFDSGLKQSAERVAEFAYHRSRRLEPEAVLYLSRFGSSEFQVTRLVELLIRKPLALSRDSVQLAYPTAFKTLMERNEGDVDPLLLLSIARRESRFDLTALSPAGAQGLLQLHPDTVKRITGGIEVDINHPWVNVQLGSYRFRELVRTFDGIHWAIAGYNAGEPPTRSWILRFPNKDPLLAIDLITYRETRNYVASVLHSYYWYRHLYEPREENPLSFLLSGSR